MIIFEVRQQLEHSVALFLKVSFNLHKFLCEFLTLNSIFIHLFKQSAKQLTHMQYILKCFQHSAQIQEALLSNRVQIFIMK